jgi:hypothetical protein
MTMHPLPDPLEQLSRADRRRWRQESRRVEQAYEAAQLQALRGLAASGAGVRCLSTIDRAEPTYPQAGPTYPQAGPTYPQAGPTYPQAGPTYPQAGAVELLVDGRRLVGRASAAALASLEAAIARGPVRIGGAGRYGPFWTLTFEGPDRPLVVLADRVALLPSAGEVAARPRLPGRQLAG